MSNLGNVKDIFSKTNTKPLKAKNKKVDEVDPPKKRGRPIVHEEPIIKTVVTLRKSQLIWLDRLSLEIREKSDQILDRGVIIRALVDALHASKLDLSNIKSEQEASLLIERKLKKK